MSDDLPVTILRDLPELTPDGSLIPDLQSLINYCKKLPTLLFVGEFNKISIESRQRIASYDLVARVPFAKPYFEDPNFLGDSSGLIEAHSTIFAPISVLEQINKQLRDEDADVRRISTWPIDRAFVYIDVSDFSKERPGRQMFITSSIIRSVMNDAYWPGSMGQNAREGMEKPICIGDGYIFIFKKPANAALFAGFLAHLIELLAARGKLPVDFHFRIGAHVGPVYSFWDPGRDDWNYIGDGIIGGQRVVGAIGKDLDDVVFVSSEIRQHLIAQDNGMGFIHDILAHLHNRGRRADKHGQLRRVYELNHSDLLGPQILQNNIRWESA